MAVESAILPQQDEERNRELVRVQVRITNTAPASEGRPDIRFRNVRLDVTGAETRSRLDREHLEPGQTATSEFTVAAKGLASVEFRVSGEIDQDRLFQVRRRNTLPDEIVAPLLEQLRTQFEDVGIEEALTKVIETVARIQPDMTLAEVSALRNELEQLKPLIAEKRQTLGGLFREYHINRESPLGAPLREVIILLEDLETNKITAMDNAISNTDLESIRAVAHDFEQLQISVLRVRETIRERMRPHR